MPTAFRLLLLTGALVLGIVATVISGPGFDWKRALSASVTLYVASQISW